MSFPRPVFPGRFYMVSRRCVQQMFLMRPDEATNNNFLYCLGEAAQRFGICLLHSMMLANHHHTVIYDRFGRINEFTQHFHKTFATSQNALRGRRENFWNISPVSVVELTDIEAVLEMIVYAATNPVKDGLVDTVAHWPGPQTLPALITGTTITVDRPTSYFRKNGKKMPATVELTFEFPDHLHDREHLRAEVARRVAQAERDFAAERARTGRGVLGRARVMRQSWLDSPAGRADKRVPGGINPRVASSSKWDRIAVLQRNKVFIAAHAQARADTLAGMPDVVFPPGTYWLKRFMNVRVAPSPS